MSFSINLTVNGAQKTVELDDPRVTLLDLLRERRDLTGAKKGCDRGQCDEADPHVNALGIKGVGEIGVTGSAGAVANAVWHATGVRVRRFPIAVEQLLGAGAA